MSNEENTSAANAMTHRPDHPIRDVSRFMLACDHRLKDQNTWELYWNLCGEELTELMDADSLDKELDGIIDSIWCLIGYGLARGYDMSGAWAEVARSNLDKIGANGVCIKDLNGKVQKPEGWRPPDLSPFIPEDSPIITK
jgi:predicted HAD superfamily Cof-like phosphohydrolase